MKVKKQKISATTTLYYVQDPDPMLVQLVNSHFQFEIGNLPEQANIKMIGRNAYNSPREVYTLEINDEIYYIKKFYPLAFKQQLKYHSLMSRGLQNFLLSQRLIAAGFNTPQPLFALVKHRGLFHNESIFVTNESKGVPLKELAISEVETGIKENIMLHFARTMGLLYKKGFIQTDTNLGNFLVEFSRTGCRLIFVDMDMIFYKPLFNTRDVLKSIARFWAYFYKGLDKHQMNDQFSVQKMIFYSHIILLSYNSYIKIKSIMYIDKKIKRHLNKWGIQALNNSIFS
jgi:hypothetical protein